MGSTDSSSNKKFLVLARNLAKPTPVTIVRLKVFADNCLGSLIAFGVNRSMIDRIRLGLAIQLRGCRAAKPAGHVPQVDQDPA